MNESIYAALRRDYGKRVLPPVGTAYDEDHYSAANGATLAEYREQYKQALKERNVKDV